MSDMSWRAPDTTPVRRRKMLIRVAIAVLVVAIIAVAAYMFVPKFKEKRETSAVDAQFDQAVEAVMSATAIEVRGRALMRSAGDVPVYYTAVRLPVGTLVGDVRDTSDGFGLPVVDAGDKVYAQGDSATWPLMGLRSDFSGWLEATPDNSVNLAAASVTKEDVREIVEDEGTVRDGLIATSPAGSSVEAVDSSTLYLVYPLSGDKVAEYTVRAVDSSELESAQEAVANAVSNVGARIITKPDGGLMIEAFAAGGEPAPEPAPHGEPQGEPQNEADPMAGGGEPQEEPAGDGDGAEG